MCVSFCVFYLLQVVRYLCGIGVSVALFGTYGLNYPGLFSVSRCGTFVSNFSDF